MRKLKEAAEDRRKDVYEREMLKIDRQAKINRKDDDAWSESVLDRQQQREAWELKKKFNKKMHKNHAKIMFFRQKFFQISFFFFHSGYYTPRGT